MGSNFLPWASHWDTGPLRSIPCCIIVSLYTGPWPAMGQRFACQMQYNYTSNNHYWSLRRGYRPSYVHYALLYYRWT